MTDLRAQVEALFGFDITTASGPVPSDNYVSRAAVLALIEARAAPLDVERLYDALAHWYDGADGGESFRLVPMSSDGGVMPTGDLHPFAAAIAREYAKDPQP